MTGKKVDYQLEFEQVADKKEIQRRLTQAYDILFKSLGDIFLRKEVNTGDQTTNHTSIEFINPGGKTSI